jgi:hypothetical protein
MVRRWKNKKSMTPIERFTAERLEAGHVQNELLKKHAFLVKKAIQHLRSDGPWHKAEPTEVAVHFNEKQEITHLTYYGWVSSGRNGGGAMQTGYSYHFPDGKWMGDNRVPPKPKIWIRVNLRRMSAHVSEKDAMENRERIIINE